MYVSISNYKLPSGRGTVSLSDQLFFGFDILQVLFLYRVAVSKTVPFLEATKSCVKCVQLWNVSLDHP